MSKHPTLGSRKWSADHYVVRSPLQGVNEKENQQNPEPKTKQAAKAKQHQTTRETATPQWKCSIIADSLCADELGMILHKAKQHNQTTARSKRRCKNKNRSAVPKPRIPPARIPEIALRNQQAWCTFPRMSRADCWSWLESLLVHLEVSSAIRRKATSPDQKCVLCPNKCLGC